MYILSWYKKVFETHLVHTPTNMHSTFLLLSILLLTINGPINTWGQETSSSPAQPDSVKPNLFTLFLETVGCSILVVIVLILGCVAYTHIKDCYKRSKYGVTAIYHTAESECHLEALNPPRKDLITTIYMPD